MERTSKRLMIPGKLGNLAAILELPQQSIKAYGLFSHCFSCTKDLKAIVKISRLLATRGYAVLRFDFAGLGSSDGDFSETTFLDNLNDVRSVVDYVNTQYAAPRFLIGHSLGGSAMLATAEEFGSVQAVAAIAAPSDTNHLANTIQRLNPAVESEGAGMVNTGTYEYLIKKPTIDVLREYDLPTRISQLERRVMVFHSPADRTLGYEHAEAIAATSAGPANLINLESANHLLTDNPADSEFVASTLANWFDRFLS